MAVAPLLGDIDVRPLAQGPAQAALRLRHLHHRHMAVEREPGGRLVIGRQDRARMGRLDLGDRLGTPKARRRDMGSLRPSGATAKNAWA